MILLRRFSAAMISGLVLSALLGGAGEAERIRYPSPVDKPLLNIDFEGPVFEDPGLLVKDHTLILNEGVYHLFYIRGEETEFGHASSADLRHWEIHQPVLEAGPESCDSYRIWAPHMIPRPDYPSLYYIYYTGVNSSGAQSIYFARSVFEISSWRKGPFPLLQPYHADTSWIEWDETSPSHFRDPFFFSDNGSDYLLATARTRDNMGAIALASGSGFVWEDAGPLYLHNNGNLLESASVIRENGRYHLFFTESSVGGISHMAADSLTGDWDISTRSIIDPGHACELLDLGGGEYLFSRHTAYNTADGKLYTIRFDTLSFDTPIPEVRRNRTLDRDWEILWGNAFDHQPVYGNPYLYRGVDTVDVGREGNWWIGTYESFDGPIYGSAPGSVQGDAPRGAVRGRDFTVRGRSMRLLVGGGNKPDSCYVALCRAGTGEIIYSETGENSDSMTERFWDLDPLRGSDVYLSIVDNASGDFGHINVDGIEERGRPILPHPDSIRIDGPGPRDIDPLDDEASGIRSYRGSPQPGSSIRNYPNPFNPATTIIINSAPDSDREIRIYSASGRLIRSIRVRCGSDGTGIARWRGRDNRGNRVSSGVYTAVLSTGGRPGESVKLVLIR
ncbi:MAG: family 43 glycosylhydrolase [Candidatus Latescibacteria bacterium]|nr:family 43 glycosylhydrolase [bacterium]MBD3423908.1 family 43 glycosylhydrolase [Candidatus Latescibacterota bacterium]